MKQHFGQGIFEYGLDEMDNAVIKIYINGSDSPLIIDTAGNVTGRSFNALTGGLSEFGDPLNELYASLVNANTFAEPVTFQKVIKAPSYTDTTRDAIASPAEGMVIYNSERSRMEYYAAGGGGGWFYVDGIPV